MTSSYFAPLVLLPTVITRTGKYLTRAGEVVTIDVISTRHDLGCVGYYADGTSEQWHRSGRLYASTECSNDILSKMEDDSP